MPETTIKKRYPDSKVENIADAYDRGYMDGIVANIKSFGGKRIIHAHWENIGGGHAECSNCGMTVSADYPASPSVHYCAKCGAKMDEKTEEKK